MLGQGLSLSLSLSLSLVFQSEPNQMMDSGFDVVSSEQPIPPPPPCIEVLSTELSFSAKSSMEQVNLNGGFTLLKGRVSTRDVLGLSNSDLVPGKYEGGLKLWEGSLDLVNFLLSEVQAGQLCLKGKRVLELGCGHGLPGIFTCLQGASVVHFQDFNAEVLQYLTIPNVKANLSKSPLEEQPALSSEASTEVRFFSGDWSEVHHMLFPKCQKSLYSCCKQDRHGGYDVILMAETVYSPSSLSNLYGLIKKCLCRDGVVFLAAKKHYFGVGGGTRQFQSVVDKDGVMAASLVAEVANGSSNVREVWKYSYK